MQVNTFFSKKRLWAVIIPTILVTGILIYKFGKLAFTPQQQIVPPVPSVERGSIVDRNGKPLAVQTNFYHVGISPSAIEEDKIDAFAETVADVLEMLPSEIAVKIRSASNSSFTYIKKKITEEQYLLLKEITDRNRYNFVRFDRIPGRVYPENDLACHLIGYMGDEGSGLGGIEYSEQRILSPTVTSDTKTSVHGKNIYLTIDANLQYKLEKIAKNAMETTQAETLMMIAAEAKTGEILSYIKLPSVNLNKYFEGSEEEKKDRLAADAYEPGSVFKIFTVASLIDSGAFTRDTEFLCDGVYEKKTNSGERIKITCLDHHGYVTAREALKYSCNDALAQMSDLMKTDAFLNRIRSFGFGEKTGITLPLEAEGLVKDMDSSSWSARSKPTIAIGQEITVSALQMVQAASAIANKGIPVKPTVIQRITDIDGNVEYQHEPEYKDRVIKAATADYVLSCMETTAQSGTGSRASLSDISIGVKTGTAQMADPNTRSYSETDFLSNCMAIFPVEDPQIILYIVIEKAKGETYAGRIVAPVIAQAADEIIDHLGMNRAGAASLSHSGRISISSNAPIQLSEIVPDFTGYPKRDLLPLLEYTNIHFSIKGEGWVTSQNPAPGTPLTENMTIELYLE